MSTDIRNILNDWRKYKTSILKEENENQELSDDDKKNELSELKKAIGGNLDIKDMTKTKEGFIYIRGEIKIANDILSFELKPDECLISTEKLNLNENSNKLITQLYAYYPLWVKKWQEKSSSE
jgi:hypothetical protein